MYFIFIVVIYYFKCNNLIYYQKSFFSISKHFAGKSSNTLIYIVVKILSIVLALNMSVE